MKCKILSIKGMMDIMPDKAEIFQYLINLMKNIMYQYAYKEIILPIVEKNELFYKTVGSESDIIEKETYNFSDKNGSIITLRPEGTIGCIRAILQSDILYNNKIQKVFYYGPMFRYERPQAGRYRQFYQFGLETLGLQSSEIEAELLDIQNRLWENLGLTNSIKLQINTLGSYNNRKIFKDILTKYLIKFIDEFDDSDKKKIYTNPLRILDSKKDNIQNIIKNSPKLIDYLDKPSLDHFTMIQKHLYNLNIDFIINYDLVRGLDYYSHTVFEWVTDQLGSQGTISAGGRYDGITKNLCSQDIPGAGFAIGIDRLLLLLEKNNFSYKKNRIIIYLIDKNIEYPSRKLFISNKLRNYFNKITIFTEMNYINYNRSLKQAYKQKSDLVISLDYSENVFIKYLSLSIKDTCCNINNIIDTLKPIITKI
jgi:histidyl-tRNA synthetase